MERVGFEVARMLQRTTSEGSHLQCRRLLVAKPIDEVISAIKRCAVIQENTMVARAQLHQMHQDRDELICSFCARPNPRYHVHAHSKQPWHQNPWCSHLMIFCLLQIWPAPQISTNCVRNHTISLEHETQ